MKVKPIVSCLVLLRVFHYVSSRRARYTRRDADSVGRSVACLSYIPVDSLKIFRRVLVGIALINTCFSNRVVFTGIPVSVSVSVPQRSIRSSQESGCWVGKLGRRMQDAGTRAGMSYILPGMLNCLSCRWFRILRLMFDEFNGPGNKETPESKFGLIFIA